MPRHLPQGRLRPLQDRRGDAADLLRERQVGLHRGRRDGREEGLRQGQGRRRRDRRRAPGLLHPRLRGGEPPGRPRPRQPRRDAARRRDGVLRVPRRPRVVRRRRGRDQDRAQREQGPQDEPPRDPQRPRQGRRVHHLAHQRLHLREDGLRQQDREGARGRAQGVLQGPARGGELLRRGQRPGGRRDHEARERGRVHHGQLHEPDALPAPGRGHLQEVVCRERQEVLLRRLGRRHRPHAPPGQHGRGPVQLRHDGHDGPHALRRAVRRLQLGARAARPATA